MRHLGALATICLAVAGLAMAATAPTASAKSLFYLCSSGLAENPLLCPLGTGPFTEELAKKITWNGSGGGAAQLVSSAGSVKCSSTSSEGETESSALIPKAILTFHGCKDTFGKECKTGAEAEVVKTKPLSGELVDLETGEKRVGILLRPTTGTQFASEIKCTITVTVTGEVIGEILPENSYGIELELVFKLTGTSQKWRQIEEAGSFHELSVSSSKAALESIQILKFSKSLGAMA
jgi:hypothetical protein